MNLSTENMTELENDNLIDRDKVLWKIDEIIMKVSVCVPSIYFNNEEVEDMLYELYSFVENL